MMVDELSQLICQHNTFLPDHAVIVINFGTAA